MFPLVCHSADPHKRPSTLLMTRMCPERLLFMSGMTSLIMRTTPKKLVSNTCFMSSRLRASMGPTRPTPALLTTNTQMNSGWSWRLKRETDAQIHHLNLSTDEQKPAETDLCVCVNSLSMSICRSLTLSTHCLTDSSLQTSSVSRDRVRPYASPASSTNLSFRFRSRIVAMTEHTHTHTNEWVRLYRELQLSHCQYKILAKRINATLDGNMFFWPGSE